MAVSPEKGRGTKRKREEEDAEEETPEDEKKEQGDSGEQDKSAPKWMKKVCVNILCQMIPKANTLLVVVR